MLLERRYDDAILPGVSVISEKENDSPMRMLDVEKVYFCDPTLEYYPRDWSPINVTNGCTSGNMGVTMGLVIVDILCDASCDPRTVDGTPCPVSPLKAKTVSPTATVNTSVAYSPSPKALMQRGMPSILPLLSAFDSTVVGGIVWRNGMPVAHCVSRDEYLAESRDRGLSFEDCEEFLAQLEPCMDDDLDGMFLEDVIEDFEQRVACDLPVLLHDAVNSNMSRTITDSVPPKKPKVAREKRAIRKEKDWLGTAQRRPKSKGTFTIVNVAIKVGSEKTYRISMVPLPKTLSTVEPRPGTVSIFTKVPVTKTFKSYRGVRAGKAKQRRLHKNQREKV